MDARQYAPATQRNREPILAVLDRNLAPDSKILEIASGTGEHAIFFTQQNPNWHWIPSDPNPTARESILAWKNQQQQDNLALPLTLDVIENDWYVPLISQGIKAIVNINMIHISPWNACLGLMAGAEKILTAGGILYLYGPFKRNGEHTAESNARFDLSLRDRNSDWGVRDLEVVIETATAANLQLQQIVEMPANNLSVIFMKG